jgi:putative oxidoreductase
MRNPLSNPLFDAGALLLRLSLGAVLLAHSVYLKLMVFTLPGTAQFFTTLGLPGWMAYAVFAGEAIGALLLIFGIRVRSAALLMIPILLGATWAHWANGWLFTAANGGWEYPLFLALVSAAVALIGGGAYAVAPDRSATRLRTAITVTPNTRQA